MAKDKFSRSSPAEEYLRQVTPQRPARGYYRGPGSIIAPKHWYKIIYKRSDEIPKEPTSRFFYKAGNFVSWILWLIIGSFLMVGINDLINGVTSGDSYYLATFITGIVILVVIMLFARDASKSSKRKSDEDE